MDNVGDCGWIMQMDISRGKVLHWSDTNIAHNIGTFLCHITGNKAIILPNDVMYLPTYRLSHSSLKGFFVIAFSALILLEIPFIIHKIQNSIGKTTHPPNSSFKYTTSSLLKMIQPNLSPFQSIILVKTGTSIQSYMGTSSESKDEENDAFLKYSNDEVRVRKLKAGEEGFDRDADMSSSSTAESRSSSSPSKKQKTLQGHNQEKREELKRKTRISFEMHPHALLEERLLFLSKAG